MQNAIKLENISNLITSPSSYQGIHRKTRLVHFVIHGRHTSIIITFFANKTLAGKAIQRILYGSFRITSCINPRHQYHPESFSSRDDIGRGLIQKEPYHIMFIIYLNKRKSCSVL